MVVFSDRCQLVADVIVDELVNTKVEGHEKRCAEHLVPALYRIGNADPDNFPELLNKMMLKTRDSRAKIRYRALIVLELLIEKIGDGVQPHLSILLPFLNELIEGNVTNQQNFQKSVVLQTRTNKSRLNAKKSSVRCSTNLERHFGAALLRNSSTSIFTIHSFRFVTHLLSLFCYCFRCSQLYLVPIKFFI